MSEAFPLKMKGRIFTKSHYKKTEKYAVAYILKILFLSPCYRKWMGS